MGAAESLGLARRATIYPCPLADLGQHDEAKAVCCRCTWVLPQCGMQLQIEGWC